MQILMRTRVKSTSCYKSIKSIPPVTTTVFRLVALVSRGGEGYNVGGEGGGEAALKVIDLIIFVSLSFSSALGF